MFYVPLFDLTRRYVIVNESEERRRELLRQTRKLYDDNCIPAIHPRYGNLYRELYQENSEQTQSGSFIFRLTLALLFFICYVWIDYAQVPVLNVNSDQIVTQIEKTIETSQFDHFLQKELRK